MPLTEADIKKMITICRAHGARRIGVFGSVARGEERPESDLDLLVRFKKPLGLLAIVRLERELSATLGRKVDLLTEGAISPYIRVRIQDDLRVVYEEK
ncbi:MAG: nucleotidyltransferase family protein [Candidatus Eisenbacteria bacterium]|nr:nucleotidyltransferase family protein [Candidatus Eisenbacteria bacterium]